MKIVAVRAVEHLTGAYSVIFRADAFWKGPTIQPFVFVADLACVLMYWI